MFTFELKAKDDPSYVFFVVKLGGKVIGVILDTIDKDGERWCEARVLSRGYEERELVDSYLKEKPHVS
jgi:hypothetical protein